MPPAAHKFVSVTIKTIAIAIIWIGWLWLPMPSAWLLHHKYCWRAFQPEGDSYIRNATFVPATNARRELILVSFDEIEKLKEEICPIKADEFHLFSSVINNKIDEFNKIHNVHRGVVDTARMILKNDMTEFSIFNTNGWEMRWRYKILGNTAHPIEWYEIHDTGGIVLLQIGCIGWLVLLPIAILASRKTKRFKHAHSTRAEP